MQRGHALVVEGHLAANEYIEDDAKTPYVNFRASINLRVEKLGCCEVQGSAECSEMCRWIVEVCETEVDDFDVAGLGDEDVFDLEIPGEQCRSCGNIPAPLPIRRANLRATLSIVSHG